MITLWRHAPELYISNPVPQMVELLLPGGVSSGDNKWMNQWTNEQIEERTNERELMQRVDQCEVYQSEISEASFYT